MQTLSPPTMPPSTNTNEYKCSGLPVVPTNLTELFKNDLIYFIHHRLPNGFKMLGRKWFQYHAVKVNFMQFLKIIYTFTPRNLVFINVGFVEKKERRS
ncbi:5713_t:CDS:2 [Rhizophagus irregularis]|nr:5713_t:CDS:2 [Rhizophagus irregularis]